MQPVKWLPCHACKKRLRHEKRIEEVKKRGNASTFSGT